MGVPELRKQWEACEPVWEGGWLCGPGCSSRNAPWLLGRPGQGSPGTGRSSGRHLSQSVGASGGATPSVWAPPPPQEELFCSLEAEYAAHLLRSSSALLAHLGSKRAAALPRPTPSFGVSRRTRKGLLLVVGNVDRWGCVCLGLGSSLSHLGCLDKGSGCPGLILGELSSCPV